MDAFMDVTEFSEREREIEDVVLAAMAETVDDQGKKAERPCWVRG